MQKKVSDAPKLAKSQRNQLTIVKEEYTSMRNELNSLISRVEKIEKQLENLPLPYIKEEGKDWRKN